jgi:hypothetical protein
MKFVIKILNVIQTGKYIPFLVLVFSDLQRAKDFYRKDAKALRTPKNSPLLQERGQG